LVKDNALLQMMNKQPTHQAFIQYDDITSMINRVNVVEKENTKPI
jgi:hypothetical protein